MSTNLSLFISRILKELNFIIFVTHGLTIFLMIVFVISDNYDDDDNNS